MNAETLTKKPDEKDLEHKVKKMYRNVAENPNGEYHFEMGRGLAEKLGYEKEELDRIPQDSIASFAGVGYFMDMADIKEGDSVLDLGSGSGMDSFIASLRAGKRGHVTGIDMTDEQLNKASRLAKENGFSNITFIKGYIENLPFDENSFDAVISNGVINLSPGKEKVFAEVSRVLKPGGRMAIADIVTEKQLPGNITCDSTLWASCIGGAGQEDSYRSAIEKAGIKVNNVRDNTAYAFISKSAQGASKQYGVKSVSLYAVKAEVEKIKADKKLRAHGLACLNLTPEINRAMKDMKMSEILEVFNDDPASRAGIPAWCRITGNELLAAEDINKNETFYYIQKKN